MKSHQFLPALLAIILASCEKTEPSAQGKLRVLTTFLPLQAHATAIAGDLAEVEQLLARDTGPHDFQFTPADVTKLADSDLFIINGGGLEEWLDELVEKAGAEKLNLIDCSEGLTLLPSPADLDPATSLQPGDNPHTWLDPRLARQQAATILAALQKADPKNAAAYAENFTAYAEKLDALDAEFQAVLDPLPNKNLVTFHEAFPYLAARYGLNYVGAISEFPEKDPPPQDLAALIDRIRAAKVGVLFAESGYAPGLLKRIASETDARVSELDTLEVGQGDPQAYLDRMRKNLIALQMAFSKP